MTRPGRIEGMKTAETESSEYEEGYGIRNGYPTSSRYLVSTDVAQHHKDVQEVHIEYCVNTCKDTPRQLHYQATGG